MGTSRIGVFVQVRLSSSRLPRKALLPLGEKRVVEHVMDALKRVPAEHHALLTVASSAPALRAVAEAYGFKVFVGPEQDVLRRYCNAVRAMKVDRVVRATGDNPLVSPRLTVSIMNHHEACGADLSHYLGIPLGTGVEVVESEALLRAERSAVDPAEREHITTFLYRHPEQFSISEPWAEKSCTFLNARVSLDTEEDLRVLQAIFRDLYQGGPIETEKVVSWLRDHPSFVRVRGIEY